MAMPVDIQKKIDSVKDRCGHLKHYCHYSPHDHCTYEKICCKLCGCTIRSLVPHEKTGHLIMVNCPNYTIVTLEFDDGSAHETPMCKSCAVTLTDDQQEQIYAQDLLQMEEEERRGMGSVAWSVFQNRHLKKKEK